MLCKGVGFILVFSLCMGGAECMKILMMPINAKSHLMCYMAVGEYLVQKGHDVYFSFSSAFQVPPSLHEKGMKVVTYQSNFKFGKIPSDNVEFQSNITRAAVENPWSIPKMIDIVKNVMAEESTSQLMDDNYFKRLKELNFDIAVLDRLLFGPEIQLVPYRLNVPFVFLYDTLEPWLARVDSVPRFPSVTPFALIPFSEKMTFFERFANFMVHILFPAAPLGRPLEDHVIQRCQADRPFSSVNDVIDEASFVLVTMDILLSHPMPLSPNVAFVGGLTTQPSNPLSQDLEQFMNSGEKDVVIVSFGSMAKNLPETVHLKFAKAFSSVPYKVIWQYLGDENKIPQVTDNVKLLTWLPQNDLLGHPRTKLFITHCGNKGQFEALYHGVPMLGIPLFADQHHNCARQKHHGYGTCLSVSSFTSAELVDLIKETLSNPSYSSKIKKASKIYRSRAETPKERVLYWLEHVHEFGGDHLKSYAHDMPFYQYLMIDIFVTLFLIITVMGCLLYCLCCRAMPRMFKKCLNKKIKQQ